MFNYLIGTKTTIKFDSIENYRPIQVLYWIVNPYYDKIYESVADKWDLIGLRNEFFSKDFWQFVLCELNIIIDSGYDYKHINIEFESVVNGLFKWFSNNTKRMLEQVSSVYKKICKMSLN